MTRDADPGRLARFGLLLGAAAMFANMYSTQGILPLIEHDLHTSTALAGGTIAAVIGALAVGSWFAGPLSDRIGRRRVLIGSCALLVFPTLACAFVPSIGALLVVRLLQGLCMPGLLTVGTAFIREAFPAGAIAPLMGLYSSSLVAGGLVGRLGTVGLADVIGWKAALAMLALPTAIAALVMVRTLPPEPYRPRLAAGTRAALRLHLRTRAILLNMAIGPSLFFVFQALYSYVGYRLVAAPFGLSRAHAGWLFAIWVVGIAGPSLAGTIAARIGAERLLLPIVVTICAGVALSIPDQLPTLILALIAATMAMFASHTCCQIVLANAAQTDRGAAASLYMSVYYTAGSLGAVLPGFGWEWGGWRLVCLIASPALVLALGSAFVLSRDAKASA